MIDSHTQLVGLIGWPVEHSLSPQMHNAAIHYLGINWRYIAMPVRPVEIKQAIHGLACLGFRGCNVTIPHKQAVIPLMDHVSPTASTLGAVNTIVFSNTTDDSGDYQRKIIGENTDEHGFIQGLLANDYKPQSDHTAVVLGAGGSARSVIVALVKFGIKKIIILNRSLERGQQLVSQLVSFLQSATTQIEVHILHPDCLIREVNEANLLVNTTPIGMWPETSQELWPASIPFPRHLTVYDLVYNPIETRLLRQARLAGANPISGLEMLVHQGALAFELWTGCPAPIKVMRNACERALLKYR